MIPIRLSLGEWSPVIRRMDGDASRAGRMALTFDDGPEPETTPHLLSALAAAGATATFFLCGVRVERHPELVRAMIDGGHAVYAHGWDHVDYSAAEGDAALAATLRTEKLLARHRPTPAVYLVRLPYNAGFKRRAMHRAMRRLHPDIQFAWWSHGIADYAIAGACRSETEIAAACADAVARLERRGDLAGGILLLHDAAIDQPQPGAIAATRFLLPEVLRMLKRRRIAAVRLEPTTRHPILERYAFRSPEPFTIFPPGVRG